MNDGQYVDSRREEVIGKLHGPQRVPDYDRHDGVTDTGTDIQARLPGEFNKQMTIATQRCYPLNILLEDRYTGKSGRCQDRRKPNRIDESPASAFNISISARLPAI